MMRPGRLGVLAAAAIAFVVLATANSNGYRYGVSDQAFYLPAVVKDLHPSFFPHDTPLLFAEARLTWSDEIVAGLSRLTGADLPPLFLALYLVTLVALFSAAVAFGRAAGLSWWATAALLLLLTLRHRIARTAANSLEGYMHPREVAFALGVWTFACLLRGRMVASAALLIAAACWHPTTAVWFAVATVPGFLAGQWRRWRVLAPVAGVAAVAVLWAMWRGPLAGRLVRMDPPWLSVLAEKDYLFPHEWPLYAWLMNLAYPLVIVLIYRRRRSRGVAVPREGALVAGMFILFAAFVVSVPLAAARLALAVQLQVTRVFWLLDLLAAVYLAWWLIDMTRRSARGRVLVIGILAAVSAGRGGYLLAQGRPLFAVRLPETPWVDAMSWLERQPASWYVLADPGHAWKYGVSVRVAAEKDTLVEAGKDSAIAMYDRPVAMRVGDRLAALRDFDRLTAEEARVLARRFGLDVVIVERGHELKLPELFRNSQFVIYDLR